jgi:hypothetical protein
MRPNVLIAQGLATAFVLALAVGCLSEETPDTEPDDGAAEAGADDEWWEVDDGAAEGVEPGAGGDGKGDGKDPEDGSSALEEAIACYEACVEDGRSSNECKKECAEDKGEGDGEGKGEGKGEGDGKGEGKGEGKDEGGALLRGNGELDTATGAGFYRYRLFGPGGDEAICDISFPIVDATEASCDRCDMAWNFPLGDAEVATADVDCTDLEAIAGTTAAYGHEDPDTLLSGKGGIWSELGQSEVDGDTWRFSFTYEL